MLISRFLASFAFVSLLFASFAESLRAAEPSSTPSTRRSITPSIVIEAEETAVAEPQGSVDTSQTTHQQVSRIEFVGKDGANKLISFCLAPDGRVVSLVSLGASPGRSGTVRRTTGYTILKTVLNPLLPKAGPRTSADGKAESATKAAMKTLGPAPVKSPQTAAVAAEIEDFDAAAAAATPAQGIATPSGYEVRILDADGKPLKSWPVEFEAQAMNIGRDGNVYLAGNGHLACYDLDGKLLRSGESPQMADLEKDPESLRKQAEEEIESGAAAQAEMVKRVVGPLETQLKKFEGKSDEDLTPQQRTTKRRLESQLKVYANMEVAQAQQVEQVMASLQGRRKRVNAMAVNDKHVFITCGASKGYGYAVWRTDLDFVNPKMIVKSLSGCCGQMDIQCDGDQLVVAENSRHRVGRYDADGELVSNFGKRSRNGEAECFGGCCNPMNTQVRGDKLYVSESDGQVKLFQPDGTFVGLVGVAKVRPGCKSSLIGVSPDGKRVYYIDVNESAILMLAEKAADADNQARVR